MGFQPLKAVFTYANHLTDDKQHIYFFNDIHDACDKASDQQIHIISFAKQLNAVMLTEEMTNTDTLKRYLHDADMLNQVHEDCLLHLAKEESEQFPLRGLALCARSMGVDAKNIDYRQWVDAFRTGRAITGRAAMQVLDRVIADIKSYNDNAVFNGYYASTVAMVTNSFKPFWDYLRQHNGPVRELTKADEFKKITTDMQQLKLDADQRYNDYWITYDSSLFNCLLLHELAQQKQTHIIVCAGAFHCNLASDMLEKIGFHTVPSHACGQRDLGTTPMNMKAFMHRVLQDRLPLCLNASERKEIINQAVNNKGTYSSYITAACDASLTAEYSGFMPILLFLLFVMVLIATYACMCTLYR